MTTMEHFNNWLEQEFPHPDDRDAIGPRMLAVYDEDPEYWAGVGWWKLYDELQRREK